MKTCCRSLTAGPRRMTATRRTGRTCRPPPRMSRSPRRVASHKRRRCACPRTTTHFFWPVGLSARGEDKAAAATTHGQSRSQGSRRSRENSEWGRARPLSTLGSARRPHKSGRGPQFHYGPDHISYSPMTLLVSLS